MCTLYHKFQQLACAVLGPMVSWVGTELKGADCILFVFWALIWRNYSCVSAIINSCVIHHWLAPLQQQCIDHFRGQLQVKTTLMLMLFICIVVVSDYHFIACSDDCETGRMHNEDLFLNLWSCLDWAWSFFFVVLFLMQQPTHQIAIKARLFYCYKATCIRKHKTFIFELDAPKCFTVKFPLLN